MICICTNIYIVCVEKNVQGVVMLLRMLRPCPLTDPDISDSSSFLWRERKRRREAGIFVLLVLIHI